VDKTEQERMQAVFDQNPKIGRYQLAHLAGTTENIARGFLGKQRSMPMDTGLTREELRLIRSSMRGASQIEHKAYTWSGERIKFAHITDTHFGHKLSRLDWWQKVCDLIAKEGCQLVFHTGDITEGMNKRDGHVYELEAIGATNQVQLAVDRLSLLPCPCYGINGNHDLWGYKTIGHDVAQAIADKMPGRFFNLGVQEADFQINNIIIKLWHGEDGASYATSYRTQKFVEGLAGGEKPHILLVGHDHKEIAHTVRNVRVFGGGTLCGQTRWMRDKKLSAHCGFRIIEVWTNDLGIERIREEWTPFYI